jgi:transcriptional regulator with GAF, ATPase, and Fis domain
LPGTHHISEQLPSGRRKLNALLKNATRICGAKFGTMYRHDGKGFNLMATHSVPAAFVEARRRAPVPPPGTALAIIAVTKQTVHIRDLTKDPAYATRDPFVVASLELSGCRTLLMVPMLKDNQLIGAISIIRREADPTYPSDQPRH